MSSSGTDTNNLEYIVSKYKYDLTNRIFGGNKCSGFQICSNLIRNEKLKDVMTPITNDCKCKKIRYVQYDRYFRRNKDETQNKINEILHMISQNENYAIYFKIKYFLNTIFSEECNSNNSIFSKLRDKRFDGSLKTYVSVFDIMKKDIEEKENDFMQFATEYNDFANELYIIDDNISNDFVFLCFYVNYSKKQKGYNNNYNKIMKEINEYVRSDEHNIIYNDLKNNYNTIKNELTEKYMSKIESGYYDLYYNY